MDAYEAVITRRSTRKYTNKIPSKKIVEKVVEAGRHAPSGHNSQTSHFIVIRNAGILSELSDLVTAEFAAMEIADGMYASLRNAIERSKKGTLVFHYGAPVLIVVANRIGYGNAMADSACAIENMMIAANALDLGSCWVNQLHWLTEHEAIRNFMYALGMEQNETITGSMVLGYSADGLPPRNALERKGNPVTWIG